MKIGYISNFRKDIPSLADYSDQFFEILESQHEVIRLNLGKFHFLSSSKAKREIRSELQDFLENEGPIEALYLEVVNHHIMVWAILLNHKLLEGIKIYATIHDPPLPVNAFLSIYCPIDTALTRKFFRALDLIGLSKIVHNRLVKMLDGVVCLTQSGKEKFVETYDYNGCAIVLPHVNFGLAKENYDLSSEDDSALTVFYAGHWWKHKGIEDLILACELLSKNNHSITLNLSGSGPAQYVDKIMRLVTEKQNPNFIIVTPGRVDLDYMYDIGNKSDCWVVPYRTTGKVAGSGVVLRAMRAGACVICSDLPQLKDILKDEEDCLMYPEGDIHALSEKILEAKKPEVSKRLRHNLVLKNNTTHSKEELLVRLHSLFNM